MVLARKCGIRILADVCPSNRVGSEGWILLQRLPANVSKQRVVRPNSFTASERVNAAALAEQLAKLVSPKRRCTSAREMGARFFGLRLIIWARRASIAPNVKRASKQPLCCAVLQASGAG